MQKSNPKLASGPHKAKGEDREKVSWFVKVVVGLHVVAITSWVMPDPSTAVSSGTKLGTVSDRILNFNAKYVKHSPVQTYVLCTGFWQSWDMFAPNPSSVDIYPDAEVTLKSGRVVHYAYPRMYALSLVEKYQKERYRKFFEHANTDTYLYPPFAKRVAYLVQKESGEPAVKVVLRRHWYQIPSVTDFGDYSGNLWEAILKGKVTESVLMPPNPPLPPTYNEFDYYTYNPLTGKGKSL